MILLSLLGHAATFYVVQVAYTPNGSLLPPPARVVMVRLDEPENAPLARWLALTDPTLATQSPAADEDAVLDTLGFRYVPSYDALPPAFKALNSLASTENIAAAPRPLPPGPVAMGDTAAERAEPPATSRGEMGVAPSRVVLSGGLEKLVSLPLPRIEFNGTPEIRSLEPTIFLVGVRPGGGTPLLFPVRQAPTDTANVSTDEADEFARAYLARLPFRATDSPDAIQWGHATFYWGGMTRRNTP